ncbi:MAG TPA: cbb3-type cytochrome c oxidase subunit I [Patescibacteria group bacterium]|jgi:cytochrome o ubiquinol oxidase subunit 1|nr:cbb3-type cytochrome c oxidase subunit I [Patescibacteria group bacterium]
MFGRLDLSAFQHNIITLGGIATMGIAVVGIIASLTYFKRWKWLWEEWLTSLDPKKIGVMYLIVAAVMLLRGGGDALLIRMQQVLSVGDSKGLLSTDQFQQIFSAHGTIMIFFVAMGAIFALMNLLVPLMIGSRDVAFPFLNATSFWLFATGAVLVNLSLAVGEFGAAGWLSYPPLSELTYSPGVGIDYWIWTLQIAGVGSLLSGINFLTTILTMRAPGMTLMRMPLFIWSVLGSLALIIFAFPILTATLALLSLDRLLGMHIFTSEMGGNPMMYVNLIWAWGHPEVYILILPAFGVFSEVVATFSQKRLFGYTSMVWAIWAIVLLSFLVWLHHFFTMGAGGDVNAFFGIMTMIIAVPTGVKVFNWLFTMYRGRVHFTTPMMWFLGFVMTFTVGGMAGVLMSVPAVDFQIHNSLFLVAHFHTMIVGGVLFGAFAGFSYWFPRFTGFRLNETLGKFAFWCWQIGFLLAFGPLYILGMMGATRRLDHYDPSMGWRWLFVVAGSGVLVIGAGVGFQILQIVVSVWQRQPSWQKVDRLLRISKIKKALGLSVTENQKVEPASDPWNGRTLEWSISYPLPVYNFAVIPKVEGRDPFWVAKQTKVQPAKPAYEDIELPKNTPIGLFIAGGAFLFGFGLIWHIWWLATVGLIGVIALITIRMSDDNTDYIITAAEVENLEAQRRRSA